MVGERELGESLHKLWNIYLDLCACKTCVKSVAMRRSVKKQSEERESESRESPRGDKGEEDNEQLEKLTNSIVVAFFLALIIRVLLYLYQFIFPSSNKQE